MNKKMNKKGFTIVELVIVIAVIAILAAVMIPTFGGIIDSANKSNVLQVATAAYKEAYGVAISDGKITTGGETVETDSGYTFKFEGTSINADDLTVTVVEYPSDVDTTKWEVSVSAGVLSVTEK